MRHSFKTVAHWLPLHALQLFIRLNTRSKPWPLQKTNFWKTCSVGLELPLFFLFILCSCIGAESSEPHRRRHYSKGLVCSLTILQIRAAGRNQTLRHFRQIWQSFFGCPRARALPVSLRQSMYEILGRASERFKTETRHGPVYRLKKSFESHEHALEDKKRRKCNSSLEDSLWSAALDLL